MKPFNLEEALTGKFVVLLNGETAEIVAKNNDALIGWSGPYNNPRAWSITGKVWETTSIVPHDYDIVGMASTTYELNIPAQTLTLNEGEHYAGIPLGKNNEPDYHLILLPNKATDIGWREAKSWATEQGGELPTRREQLLLFANLRELLQLRWYWVTERYTKNHSNSWDQYLLVNPQGNLSNDYRGYACAVRRIPVQA